MGRERDSLMVNALLHQVFHKRIYLCRCVPKHLGGYVADGLGSWRRSHSRCGKSAGREKGTCLIVTVNYFSQWLQP